jgi:GNAT superfamily N-acetyltransferase
MDLKVYSLEELEPYLYILYSKPESLVPVSPLRLKSYLKNPRAEMSDPVLFEIRQHDEVIGYRTLLPDCFYDSKEQPQRFAWLSGNWVRPDMRRQGISTQLLEIAEEKWQGRLMYTNYAPESKALYDSTGRFTLMALREGQRFYMRSATEELLGERMRSGKLLGFTDHLVNELREKRIQKYRFPSGIQCQVTPIDGFLSQLAELVKRLQQDALFRRDRAIFEWALEYPWVTEQACDPVNYHFSYKANRFENILLQFKRADGEFQGVLWIILHNNVLSVPYFFAGDKALHACMAETIVRTMVENGCTHTTIRNPKLLEHMQAHRKVFLSVRKMPQRIFAHRDLEGLLPDKRVIHDGDGDVMFTG